MSTYHCPYCVASTATFPGRPPWKQTTPWFCLTLEGRNHTQCRGGFWKWVDASCIWQTTKNKPIDRYCEIRRCVFWTDNSVPSVVQRQDRDRSFGAGWLATLTANAVKYDTTEHSTYHARSVTEIPALAEQIMVQSSWPAGYLRAFSKHWISAEKCRELSWCYKTLWINQHWKQCVCKACRRL